MAYRVLKSFSQFDGKGGFRLFAEGGIVQIGPKEAKNLLKHGIIADAAEEVSTIPVIEDPVTKKSQADKADVADVVSTIPTAEDPVINEGKDPEAQASEADAVSTTPVNEDPESKEITDPAAQADKPAETPKAQASNKKK